MLIYSRKIEIVLNFFICEYYTTTKIHFLIKIKLIAIIKFLLGKVKS